MEGNTEKRREKCRWLAAANRYIHQPDSHRSQSRGPGAKVLYVTVREPR